MGQKCKARTIIFLLLCSMCHTGDFVLEVSEESLFGIHLRPITWCRYCCRGCHVRVSQSERKIQILFGQTSLETALEATQSWVGVLLFD